MPATHCKIMQTILGPMSPSSDNPSDLISCRLGGNVRLNEDADWAMWEKTNSQLGLQNWGTTMSPQHRSCPRSLHDYILFSFFCFEKVQLA